MANITIEAFVEHLNVAIHEAKESRSADLEVIGFYPNDKLRLTELLDAAKPLLDVPVKETPKSYQR